MNVDFDELAALESSSRNLEQAASAAQQRAAAIEWLRGAIVLVGDASPGAEAPGRLLEAALIALDEGHTTPVLRAGRRTSKRASAVAQARARAMAALDWLQSVEGYPVGVASRAIDEAIGVPHGTVERWRETSRSARKLNPEAAALVPAISAQWAFLASLPARLSKGESVLSLIASELAQDGPIHRAT